MTAELAWPPAICRATDSAMLIGIANPVDACWSFPSLPAVSMPITPAELASGPPESPGTMSAFVWIIPCSVSAAIDPPPSLAVMVWPSALTWPGFAVMVPRPSALPRATTAVPALTEAELPIGTVVSPDAFRSRIRAMSPVWS